MFGDKSIESQETQNSLDTEITLLQNPAIRRALETTSLISENTKDIKDNGLEPRFSIRFNGEECLVSDEFKLGGVDVDSERLARVLYVKDNRTVRYHSRMVYFSNSHSSWKTLPAYEADSRSGGVSMFSKDNYSGLNDEADLNLPIQLQKALGETVPNLENSSIARKLHQLTRRNKSFRMDDIVPKFAMQNTPDRNFGLGQGENPIEILPPSAKEEDPKSIDVFYTCEPNLNLAQDSWSFKSPLYGKVTATVYKSIDGKLFYVSYSAGVAGALKWFSQIQTTDAGLSTFGVPNSKVEKAGLLCTSPYEYINSNLGKRYGAFGFKKGRYVLIDEYLNQIPLVRKLRGKSQYN